MNDDVEIIPEIEYCKSDYMSIFVGCIYAYKGLLMVRKSWTDLGILRLYNDMTHHFANS
jgi:hypothetical protein